MLTRARAETADAAITYLSADLERVELPNAAFDVAYSSLALHYIENLGRLLGAVHRALVPGARFVFSAEHPIFTAPANPGWSAGANGRKTWPIDSYLREGPRKTNWLAEGVIMKLCGWKTRSMFDRYNVIDEQDLTQAMTKHFNGTVGPFSRYSQSLSSAAAIGRARPNW